MSTFLPAHHPRGASGRFSPVPHAESDTVLTDPACAEMIHARRLEAAQMVLADYRELEILDHSPARRDTVTLGELDDPNLALGNCWAATVELIEVAGAREFGVDTLNEATIRRSRLGGLHVALLAEDRDGPFIIDYTARQFRADLPFPYVAGVDEWMATVERASGNGWNWDI